MKLNTSKLYLSDNLQCLPPREEEIKRIVSDMEVLMPDKLFIDIEGPEFGWLDVSFNVKGKKPFPFSISDVFPPFRNLRAWMEDLANYSSIPSKSIVIDCERYSVLLSYNYLGDVETDKDVKPIALIQLGSDVEGTEHSSKYERFIQFVVPIQWFVPMLYNNLKDYCYTNRRTFWKNWRLPHSDSFEFRTFIRSIESKKLEQRFLDWERWEKNR
ncbi:MAG: hypothetical protein IJQ89_00940 [Bacteroidales bacterium]|nr:hypothetical protein [Bacteroidales bacterium]